MHILQRCSWTPVSGLRMLCAGMPSLPVAQPRNVFGGMGVSCLAGLFWRTVLGNQVWLAASLGVAFAIMGMQLSATLHREALLYTLKHASIIWLVAVTCMSAASLHGSQSGPLTSCNQTEDFKPVLIVVLKDGMDFGSHFWRCSLG